MHSIIHPECQCVLWCLHKKSEEPDNWNMFNNSDEHSQAEIPLIKYSYHTDTQSLATVCCVYVCVCVCVPVVGSPCSQFAVAQSSQKADDLNGFSQSHFISQDATCLLTVEFPQPAHTCLLVPDDTVSKCAGNLKYLQEQIREAESPWEGTEQRTCLRMNLLKKLFPEEPRYFKPFIKFFIAVIC